MEKIFELGKKSIISMIWKKIFKFGKKFDMDVHQTMYRAT